MTCCYKTLLELNAGFGPQTAIHRLNALSKPFRTGGLPIACHWTIRSSGACGYPSCVIAPLLPSLRKIPTIRTQILGASGHAGATAGREHLSRVCVEGRRGSHRIMGRLEGGERYVMAAELAVLAVEAVCSGMGADRHPCRRQPSVPTSFAVQAACGLDWSIHSEMNGVVLAWPARPFQKQAQGSICARFPRSYPHLLASEAG